MKPVGYFNTPRSIFNHALFEDEPMNKREALMWLIGEAAYEPMQKKLNNGRAYKIVNLERGQLAHSLSYLMMAWKWTSIKKVRTFLAQLEQEGLIRIERGTQSGGRNSQFPSLLTICNYSCFPFAERSDEPSGWLQGAHKGHATGTQAGTQSGSQPRLQVIENKEVLRLPAPKGAHKGHTNGHEEEEVNKRNIATQRFGEFWDLYPLKISRAAAELSFVRAISRISVDELISRTKAFAAEWARKLADRPDDKRFIPGPVKFLDDERYLEVKPAPWAPDDEEWCKRLEHYRETKFWAIGWGPSPGGYGCKVPKHLLSAPASKGAA